MPRGRRTAPRSRRRSAWPGPSAPAQPRDHEDGHAGHHREAEQPPGLIAQRRLEQAKRPGGAAEQRPASGTATPKPAGTAARTAGLAGNAAQAVVAEDQRPDAVV